MAVCSKCFGVYFGLLESRSIRRLWRSIGEIDPVALLFLSLIPIAIDWSLTVFGIWENTHVSRLPTGSILRFACDLHRSALVGSFGISRRDHIPRKAPFGGVVETNSIILSSDILLAAKGACPLIVNLIIKNFTDSFSNNFMRRTFIDSGA